MTDKRITAIYCRVACKDDGAIALQETILRDYAQKQGYGNVSVYADNGCNGLSFDRPAFARMERDIRDGRISTVIVKSLCRLSRNYLDLYKWIGDMRQRGVSFISVADNLTDTHFADTDTDNPLIA